MSFDFKSTATFPLKLGDSISDSHSSERFTRIKYNHKPGSKSKERRITQLSFGDPHKSQLTIGDDVFRFTGEHGPAEDTYILRSQGKGKERAFVLEKVTSDHVYNVVATPDGDNESELVERYPALSLDDDDDEDELLGGEDDDMPLDPNSRFDWRNLLKREKQHEQLTASKLESAAPRSNTGTPVLTPTPVSSQTASQLSTAKRAGTTPLARPTKATSIFNTNKRKAAPKAAQVVKKAEPEPSSSTARGQKRAKTETASQSKPPKPTVDTSATSSATRSKKSAAASVPQVRLQRKASTHHGAAEDDDDDGELILENIESPATTRKPNAMSLALNGQLGSGPISLKSAANSPAGPLAGRTPLASQQSHEEQAPEFEYAGDESDADEGDPDGDDGDVEDLALPSPARRPQHEEDPGEEFLIGDEEDDLSKDLVAALEEQAGDEDPAIAALAASDEESEEE